MAASATTIGSVNLVQWTMPDIAFKLTDLDQEDRDPFIFEDSDANMGALVRRGSRRLQDRVEHELLFNITARDQILAAFDLTVPAAPEFTAALENGVDWNTAELESQGLKQVIEGYTDSSTSKLGTLELYYLFSDASNGYFTYHFRPDDDSGDVDLVDYAFTWSVDATNALHVVMGSGVLDGDEHLFALAANNLDMAGFGDFDVVNPEGNAFVVAHMVNVANVTLPFTPVAFELGIYQFDGDTWGFSLGTAPSDIGVLDGAGFELFCDPDCVTDVALAGWGTTADNAVILDYGGPQDMIWWDGSTQFAGLTLPTPMAISLQIGDPGQGTGSYSPLP